MESDFVVSFKVVKYRIEETQDIVTNPEVLR